MRQPAGEAKEREPLSGFIERVTFQSAESGFCALRVKVRGQRDLITVLGSAAEVHAGEHIQASGHWEQHREHGPQFRALFLQVTPPSSREGIERYLASGLIKGIGPHFAKRLVAAFGEAVFDVIEAAPRRLLEVVGTGRNAPGQHHCRLGRPESNSRDHGVPAGPRRRHGAAVRIYKTYDADAIPLVKEDPCRLAALHNRGSIPRGVHASSGVTTPTATSSGPAHIGREYRP